MTIETKTGLLKVMNDFSTNLSFLPGFVKEQQKFGEIFEFLNSSDTSKINEFIKKFSDESGFKIDAGTLLDEEVQAKGGSLKRKNIRNKKLSVKKKIQTGGGISGIVVSVIGLIMLVLYCPVLLSGMLILGGASASGPMLLMIASFGGA